MVDRSRISWDCSQPLTNKQTLEKNMGNDMIAIELNQLLVNPGFSRCDRDVDNPQTWKLCQRLGNCWVKQGHPSESGQENCWRVILSSGC